MFRGWGFFGLASGLAAAAAAGTTWAARPALPKHSAILTGSAKNPTRFDLAQFQRGFPPGPVKVGSPADPVSLGFRQTLGEVRGKWGFPHKAFFQPDPALKDIKVDGQRLQPGETVLLSDGSSIQSGGLKASFTQTKPDGN